MTGPRRATQGMSEGEVSNRDTSRLEPRPGQTHQSGGAAVARPSTAVSVVVPDPARGADLPAVADRLARVFCGRGREYELLLVDAGAGGEVNAAAAKLADGGHPVRVVPFSGRRCRSAAAVAGLLQADGEVLVCMDADLRHPPEAVGPMLELIDSGQAAFVIGSRYVAGAKVDKRVGAARRLAGRAAALAGRVFSSAKDPTSGFFAMRRDVLAGPGELDPAGPWAALELLVKRRCRPVREVPIDYRAGCRAPWAAVLREAFDCVRHLKRLADFRFGSLSRFGQFCLVGGLGMVVDLSLYLLLLRLLVADPVAQSVRLGIARASAIAVAMTWNFWLNRRLTFSYARHQNILGQYLRYVVTNSFGALLSWAVSQMLPLLVVRLRSDAGLIGAAMAGILVGLISNFTMSHYIVFGRQKPRRGGAADPPR